MSILLRKVNKGELSIPPIPPIISTETKTDESREQFKKTVDDAAASYGYDKEHLESMKRSALEKYNKG